MDEQQHQPTDPVTPDEAAAPVPEAPALPEVQTESAEEVVAAEPSVEEIVASAEPAEEILAAEPDVAEVIAEEAPAADVVADAPSVEEVVAAAEASDPAVDAVEETPAAPVAEAASVPEPQAEAAAAESQPDAPAAQDQPSEGKKKRSRRRKGSKAAEQWGVSPTKARGIAQQHDFTSSDQPPRTGGSGQRGRSREPLPFDQLRAAAEAVVSVEGSKKALRDAFTELAPRERNDISALVSSDSDFRQRARSISAGSLAARKIGKALAAQTVAIASLEDIWAITLSKEEAAERQSRIRAAKNRDAQRAKRNEERNNRADRVSREDLAKAQDGRVGAQIRFVIQGQDEAKEDKGSKKKVKKAATANDLLDRLGY